MRAFLMHSSVDKPFVDEVAGRLGRSNIIYDAFAFPPGADLKDSISTLLPAASIGVLFASSSALESLWVRRELALSKRLVRDGKHISLVTIILDDTPLEELPPLAQKYLCKQVATPQHAVSIIRSQLKSAAMPSTRPLFMGREQDLETLASALHGRRWPLRMLCLSGLDGIGRRTLATHILQNYLATSLDVDLELDSNDGLDRLYLQAAELSGTVTTRADLEARIREASNTHSNEFAVLLASTLSSLALPNEALLIVDNGCLFTNDGGFMPSFINVLRECFKRPAFLLVLASRRRPKLRELGSELQRHIVEHPVLPLAQGKTELLLAQSFSATNIQATDGQVQELATYIAGYPPAVRLSVEHAQRYGLPAIIADKRFLADYKARQFSPIVEHLATGDLQQRALRAIGSGVYITIQSLALHLRVDDASCTRIVEELSDMSLIAPGDNNTYFLQRPIRDAVTRSFGFLDQAGYREGVRILQDLYWNDDAIPSFEILSAITLAAAYVGDTNFTNVIVPSTLMRATIEAYNARHWDRAISLATQTLALAPDRLKAREILAKGHIRKEAWADAAKEISMLRNVKYPSVHYIDGFLAWKQGQYKKAEELFRIAMRQGDNSISVVRDRAYCLFRLGKHSDANALLDRLPERAWQNRYVLDLAAQIAIELKKYEVAEQHIATMRHLGEEYDANHRLSALYMKRRRPLDSFALLENLSKDARFETHAMRADCLIELARFDAAQVAIRELKPQTSGNRDVVHGLRCKAALREGDTVLARSHYDKIRNKDLPVHLALSDEIRRQGAGAAKKTAAADLNLLYPYLADEFNLDTGDEGTAEIPPKPKSGGPRKPQRRR